MNRRTALFLTMLMGGLVPGRLLAQQAKGTAGRAKKAASTNPAPTPRPARRAAASPPDDEAAEAPPPAEGEAVDDSPPADFPNEAGGQWRQFDITRYTSLPHTSNTPQTAIIEWIFRRTESGPWHGDKLAVLNASRTQLRAYHTPKILAQVEKMVERFTDAEFDILSVRVRFVAAADTRWRYAVYSRLNPLGRGPQGQQIWSLRVEDAAMVLAQMQVYQGFRLLADQKLDMINGQTLTVETTENHNFVADLQRDNAVGMGFQQGVQQLKEGVVLRFSPLLSYEADTLDAAIELKANTLRSLHRTKIIAPRELGPSEMAIEVPEVAETRLNQTIPRWPLGQTLLISAGIQPGILQSKGGFLNLRIPGTVPTSTELLVFVDVEVSNAPPTRSPRTTQKATTRNARD